MIALDIESSGTEPEKHSIVSIGALDMDNPTNQFYDECRIWDGAGVVDEALSVNGFTKEEILDPSKKSEAEIIKAFIAWSSEVRDTTIVGQNPSFDRDFTKYACMRAKINFPFAHRTVDTHTLAFMHMVKRGVRPPFDSIKRRTALNLDAILNYAGIPDEPEPHNALTGALSHAECASRLLYGRELLEDFSMYPIPWEVPKKDSA
ncbi:hypothetical protein COU15_00120 [Candidatus Kaiserbacteria bacterium CG10_big_fil_rev_8_21_14_0_10_45_20]|uniref:Exonuclease domain-containing protein n=1 Tax=Candidatus Kaiserbacteria bacterium CG10_big_fil_rev_8_21_14_0_10_45_20 TaxID=1974607 RepID=A0A2H0UGF3_9BACT|nr:MAG: hypothetical protein COU15_00120 [Candidatus Kaiserbacteria bacterium CG10_big_fil_rev_8_21_14_0_10_45_20]